MRFHTHRHEVYLEGFQMGEKADEIIQFYYNRLNRSDWQIVNKSSKLLERKNIRIKWEWIRRNEAMIGNIISASEQTF